MLRERKRVSPIKRLEIKGARARLGYGQKYVADQLGITMSTYCNKENGAVKFSDEEKAKLANLLELTPQQTNDFLYDGKLPIGVIDESDRIFLPDSYRSDEISITTVIIPGKRTKENGT